MTEDRDRESESQKNGCPPVPSAEGVRHFGFSINNPKGYPVSTRKGERMI